MVAHACSPSSWEAEAGGLQAGGGQEGGGDHYKHNGKGTPSGGQQKGSGSREWCAALSMSLATRFVYFNTAFNCTDGFKAVTLITGVEHGINNSCRSLELTDKHGRGEV